MKLDRTEIISYISVAVIVISLFFIGTEITGYAVTENETAIVNVTILTSAALNFSTALLDFGPGYVNVGQVGATIDSEGNQGEGTWAAQTGELVLENIGNINVSLTLSTNKTVADYIGGTSPTFEAKVSNTTGNTGACTGTQVFGSYAEINQTLQAACGKLAFDGDFDEIDINFRLYIPNDAEGAKTIGIIAIGTTL